VIDVGADAGGVSGSELPSLGRWGSATIACGSPQFLAPGIMGKGMNGNSTRQNFPTKNNSIPEKGYDIRYVKAERAVMYNVAGKLLQWWGCLNEHIP